MTEQSGPDGLVTLEAIAIERVIPTGTGIEIFAFLGITAIVGLRKRPAIRDGIIDIGHRWKIIGRKFLNVGGVGIEAMAKFAIPSSTRRRV